MKEEYAADWYKTMFKRLHKFEKPARSDLDEPLRIKVKSKTKGNAYTLCFVHTLCICLYHCLRQVLKWDIFAFISIADHRLTPSYYSQDEHKSRHVYIPKNIADYEPGHSSISEREKQMVSQPNVTSF